MRVRDYFKKHGWTSLVKKKTHLEIASEILKKTGLTSKALLKIHKTFEIFIYLFPILSLILYFFFKNSTTINTIAKNLFLITFTMFIITITSWLFYADCVITQVEENLKSLEETKGI